MPQMGSTASVAVGAATEICVLPGAAARLPRRAATTEARIDSAISAEVREPMSSPAGTSIRSSSASPTPS